jgi:hypothetical protein
MDEETMAANVCAAVLSNGRRDGRFSLSIDELGRALDISRGQAMLEAMLAANRQWVRLLGDQAVELRASGIYVAKVTLDLPR